MRSQATLISTFLILVLLAAYFFTQEDAKIPGAKQVTKVPSSISERKSEEVLDEGPSWRGNLAVSTPEQGKTESVFETSKPLSVRKMRADEWASVSKKEGLEIKQRRIFLKNPFPVEVDIKQFDSARDRIVGEIAFDLGTGEILTGKVGNVINRGERDYTLQGKLPGQEMGSFTVSVYDGVAVGAFRGDQIGLRELRYVGAGVHKVQEVDTNLMPTCASVQSPGDSAIQSALDAAKIAASKAQADEIGLSTSNNIPVSNSDVVAQAAGTELDVMIAYSSIARQQEGGTAAMLALLNLGVDDANTSLSNSQVAANLRLVHTVEVVYNGSLGSTALNDITNPSDGILDNLHTLRNVYQADFVSFVTVVTDVCGIAWVMDDLDASFESHAFSVTNSDCLSNNTFAHELGHNFGCAHAVGDTSPVRGGGLYSYSHGWRWNSTSGTQYRSTMAYSPGTRALYFSNPNVFYLGGRTGVVNSEDNARSITNAKSTLALFRTASNPDDHGNTPSEATIITLGSGRSGNLETSSDKDVFSLTLSKVTYLTVSTLGVTDTFGRLLNSSGIAISSDNDSGTGSNFEITYTAQPGTYYVEVSSLGGVTGGYTLLTSGITDDHGDNTSSATPINPNSSTAGKFEIAGDEDFFSLTIASLTYLDVSTTGSTNTLGYILNSSGAILEGDDSDGPGNNFRMVRQLSPGTYYIRVRGSTGSETGNYTLICALTDGRDDHGNTFAEATPIALGTIPSPSSTSAEIELGGDSDFFTFVLPGPYDFNVQLASNGTTDTFGVLYNSAFGIVTSDDDSADPVNFQINRTLAPGTYFLKVTGYNSIETGAYNVTLGGDQIIPPPGPASGLSATSTLSNRISLTWTAGTDATSYLIYRSAVNDPSTATQIAANITGTTYSDFSATAGESYSYWVQSSNVTADSAFSASTQGHRVLLPPAITGEPGNRTIEQGTTLSISLTATTDAGSLTYQWYQGTAPNTANPVGTNSPTLSIPNFQSDSSYWARVTNAAGSKDSRTAVVTVIPAKPTNVLTDTVATGVRIQWTVAPNVSTYQIVRSFSSNVSEGSIIGTVSAGGSSLIDSNTVPNVVYYYFIRSSANGRFSNYTPFVIGTRDLSPPDVVTATTSDFDKVVVNWSFVGSATSFLIFRSSVDLPATSRLKGNVPSPQTTFVDDTAVPNEQYYYWIKSANTVTGQSEFSTSALGSRLGGPGIIVQTPADDQAPPADTNLDTPEKFRSTLQGIVKNDNDSERVDGSISVVISKDAASLSLIYLDQTLRAKSPVNPDGSIAFALTDINGDNLTLALQLKTTANGSYRLEGPLKVNNATEGQIFATANGFNAKTNPAPFAGSYTALLPHDSAQNPSLIPAGSGIGTAALATSGTFKLSLILADGTKATATACSTVDGEIPIFARPYGRGKKGQIAGVLTIRDVPNVSDFDGKLHWIRPDGETSPPQYTNGFDTIVAILGSKFSSPVAGEKLISQLSDQADNAMWSIEGGNLTPIPSNRGITWDNRNAITDSRNTKTHNLIAKATTKTGLITAVYTNNDISFEQLNMSGVVFQKQGFVAGHFAGNQESGLFVIEPLQYPQLLVTDVGGVPLSDSDPLDFGTVGIDGGTGSRVIILVNVGDGPLLLPKVPETTGDSAFYLAKESSGYLYPNQSMAVRIGYNPDSASHSGQLTVVTNDRENSPFTLNLTGLGQVGSSSENHETGINNTQFTGPPAPPVETPGTATDFDSATDAGAYNGLIFPLAGSPSAVGSISASVSFNRKTGAGTVSMKLNHQGIIGSLKGTIEAAGTVNGILAGKLTSDHAIISLNLVEAADGSPSFEGVLENNSSGSQFYFVLSRQSFSKANPSTDAGVYTSILPMTETLRSNFPGDGTGTVSVTSTGSVRGTFYLGDGSVASFSNYLTDAKRAPVYYSKSGASLSGYLNFRDTPGVSDFDGTLLWIKPGNVKTTDAGFKTEVTAIGSRFLVSKGDSALAGIPTDGVNATGALISGADPSSRALAIDISPLNLNWSTLNRITYFPQGAEKVKIGFSTKNGLVTGSYLSSDRTTSLIMRGALFQKQNRVGGHFYSTKKDSFGYFYILP